MIGLHSDVFLGEEFPIYGRFLFIYIFFLCMCVCERPLATHTIYPFVCSLMELTKLALLCLVFLPVTNALYQTLSTVNLAAQTRPEREVCRRTLNSLNLLLEYKWSVCIHLSVLGKLCDLQVIIMALDLFMKSRV